MEHKLDHENVTQLEQQRESAFKATFTGSRVVVWDHKEGSQLFRLGYFGKPSGIRKPKTLRFMRPLELTLMEALYLAEKGQLEVLQDEKVLSIEDMRRKFSACFDQFDDQYTVYADLRNLRYIPRPGLKFGADFSVYQRGPGIDHSPFLVQVFIRGSKIQPIDLVRAGRLATSVRKRYVIATVLSDQQVRYYVFSWQKP
ncbi:MAG: tRNA-intron lyase [Candidatus Hodarchaeales archaeon]